MRTFGIELETVSRIPRHEIAINMRRAGLNAVEAQYSGHEYSKWQIKPDCSIRTDSTHEHCAEMVSNVLQWNDSGRRAVKTACDAIKRDVKVNRSCGFHVHVGASDLSREGIARLKRLWNAVERVVTSSLPRSRRGGRWCKRGSSAYDRYYALNLTPLSMKGTVEFRAHSATIDPAKIISWINFCVGIVEFAASTKALPEFIIPSNGSTDGETIRSSYTPRAGSIMETVFESIINESLSFAQTYEKVIVNHPSSAFNKGHYNWYRRHFRLKAMVVVNYDGNSMVAVCKLVEMDRENISLMADRYNEMVRRHGIASSL